jgi:hypothetical protein
VNKITLPLFELARVLVPLDHPCVSNREAASGNCDDVLGHETLRSLHQDNGCDSRKVCSARRANFGVFGHLIPAVANERSFRHASANDEKWNANDCTDYSPAKWNANDCSTDYSPAK